VSNFLAFSPLMLIWSLIALFLNYDLFVESSGENGYYAVCVKKKHF